MGAGTTEGVERTGRKKSPRRDLNLKFFALLIGVSSLERAKKRKNEKVGDSNVTGSYLATLIVVTSLSPKNFPLSLFLMLCPVYLRRFCGRCSSGVLGL